MPSHIPSPTAAGAAALLLLLAGPAVLPGQQPGQPIRVQTTAHQGHWIAGHLASESAESLVIVTRSRVDAPRAGPGGRYQLGGGPTREVIDTVQLARTGLHKVEVSRGRRSNADRGAVIGGSTLGALGLAAGIACASDEFLQCTGGQVAAVTVFSAASGAFVGALFGALSHRESWTSVSVAPAVTGAGGPGLSLSLRFKF